ncbi:flavin reductase family protein [Nafulsella turpanensis]|uniref:flavin reductase family protein n=1 Tax=Nafulsella turpanensis TaxID=1265690 RepID=UPI00034CAF7A|nr:flavin reductase family protein [Nafulsella turpanensis]
MKRDSDNRLVTDSSELTQTLKKISYGFYVLTTKANANDIQERDKDYFAAGLVSWVSQCSFDPPMVLVAVQKQSDLNETIRRSKVFALNILGKADKPMISPFSKDTKVEEGRLNGYKYTEGETGCPLLNDVPAFIECHVEEVVESEADHVLFIGKVVNTGMRNPVAEPLMEWETEYHYGG